MGRSRSVVVNTIWEMGYYVVVILLGFLAPRYIMLYYGSEVNGLSATITQILNIMMILQSGATTAAIYSLYKPIVDNDIEKIDRNVAAAESFFKKIAWIFFGLMIVTAITGPFIISSKLEKINIFIAFLLMGIKSFTDLLYTAKFRIVFTAYQEKFYISIATLIEQIVYYVLVFISIFTQGHYVFIYLWFLVGCLVKIIFLHLFFKKKHQVIDTKPYQHEKLVIVGRNYALANEVSHSIVSSSITIILSAMYGLQETSVYSVYSLVGQALSLITTAVYSAFAPSFGNLSAEGNQKRASQIFGIFQFIYIVMNSFLLMCMLFLLIPFVRLYTAGVNDINYVNMTLAAVIVVSGLFSGFRIPYNILVSTHGLFKETWKQPVFSAVLSIGISIGFGLIDYAFILVGPIVFYALNFLYQHWKLKRIVPWLLDDRRVIMLLIISVMGLFLTYLLIGCVNIPETIPAFLVGGTIFAIVSLAYLLLCSMLLLRSDFMNSLNYIRQLVKR